MALTEERDYLHDLTKGEARLFAFLREEIVPGINFDEFFYKHLNLDIYNWLINIVRNHEW